MPRTGGVYSLPAGYLAVSGQTIQPSQHNPPLEDIAQALTESLPRDGSAGMIGNLPMGGNKITGLAAGTNAGDAVRRDQVMLLTGGTLSGFLRLPFASGSSPSLQFGNASHGIYYIENEGPVFTSGGTVIGRLTGSTALPSIASIVTRQAGDLRYVQATRTITAGLGLTGGGDLTANRTLTLALGQLPYNASPSFSAPRLVALDGDGGQCRIGPTSLMTQFGVAASAVTISAGTGLTGGGDLTANRTLSLDLGQLPYNASPSFANPRVVVLDGDTGQSRIGAVSLRDQFGLAASATTITAGNGLTGGGDLSTNRTINIGTPSSITRTSTNGASGSTHSHSLPAADFQDMMANSLTATSVGQFVFARQTSGGTLNVGSTVSGSNLEPSGDDPDYRSGSTLTGTWRCLGYAPNNRNTLFQRIS